MLDDKVQPVQLDDNAVIVDLTPFVSGQFKVLADPATISTIVSAAIDYYERKRVGDWQQDVSTRLAVILDKLNEIIDLIHQAVHDIIENNNENWQDFFSTNIQGPGRSWEYYDQTRHALTDVEVREVAGAFSNRLAAAVQAITLNGRFKSWGFTLVDVVRIAFVYSLLGLKIARNGLSARMVKAEVAQNVLDYLKRSISTASDEPLSFANALTRKKAELASQVLTMNAYCTRWVRLSNEGTRCTGPRDFKDCRTMVIVGQISGGAASPILGEALSVDSSDSRFGVSYYPDYPGSIDLGEYEKAKMYCNQQIEGDVKKRDSLAQDTATLSKLVPDIQTDVATIEHWMNAN